MIVQSNVKSPCRMVFFFVENGHYRNCSITQWYFPNQVIAELNKMLPKYTLTAFRVNHILTFVPLLCIPLLITKCFLSVMQTNTYLNNESHQSVKWISKIVRL